jgi:hypothetical protein
MFKGAIMRLYNLDGIEEDVQDPRFFIDEDIMLSQQEALEEILSYV